MSSPTQRTLKHLRKLGYLAEVTEKTIPRVFTKKDLFGFIDVLAIRDGEVLGVQATSGSNMAARIDKITNHENVAAVRKANIRIVVHGWRKNAQNRWVLREVDCS
jgi:hypothetical protein